mmetsp:Transcript_11535/g.46683  ORF Transcript_11535/g.46683 Transcript_11535/m.46683 type:complete len:144 (-) Transcript_11535:324-755(-)
MGPVPPGAHHSPVGSAPEPVDPVALLPPIATVLTSSGEEPSTTELSESECTLSSRGPKRRACSDEASLAALLLRYEELDARNREIVGPEAGTDGRVTASKARRPSKRQRRSAAAKRLADGVSGFEGRHLVASGGHARSTTPAL